MNHTIYIPRAVWLQKVHLKAIKKLTSAAVMPHDKSTVEANSECFNEDCRTISEYIDARFEK